MRFLVFLIVAAAFATFSQEEPEETFYLSPSIFYTNGDYSTNAHSNSSAFYNTAQITDELFLINHYEFLKINDADYYYTQQAFLAGGLINLFPYYLKFNYVHYKGSFDYRPFDFSYNDYTNLYNIDFSYYLDLFYLGASYTHLNQIGYAKAVSNQFTLRLEKIFSNEFFISLKPSLTKIEGSSNLFSASAKLHYAPYMDLIFKIGGFGGERAFYFDSDLLTIFNQNSIQKYQIFGQMEYSPLQDFWLILGYQQTKFTDYKINYLVAGIRGNFQVAK
jgi:hypothetical protein